MYASSNQSVATELFVVTPSDTVNFVKRARRLYIGVAGTLSVVDGKGNTVSLGSYPGSSYLDAEILRVNATGTTATGIVGFV